MIGCGDHHRIYIFSFENLSKITVSVRWIQVGNLKRFGPVGVSLDLIQPAFTMRIAGVEEMALDLVTPGGELDIRQRIEDRINGMEIARLEELILGFSRKQFQHITFFGGVLGFLIGCCQALLHLYLGT